MMLTGSTDSAESKMRMANRDADAHCTSRTVALVGTDRPEALSQVTMEILSRWSTELPKLGHKKGPPRSLLAAHGRFRRAARPPCPCAFLPR